MPRKVQRSVIQLIAFVAILFVILYLNRPQSTSNKIFSWTKIRYKTSSSIIPEARGICPGLAGSTKPALVVSRVAADGDPSWLDPLSAHYHLCIYNVDAPADKSSKVLQVPANRGHEAMTYLTFLIDNYADIPAAGAVFVHGTRFAWHNDSPDYDNAKLLRALSVKRALQPTGYHNLRCDWSAGTCPSSVPAQGSLEMRLSSAVSPWNARAASDLALPKALGHLFGGDDGALAERVEHEVVKLGRNDAVRAQCCAQFAVGQDRVWQHSREEYIALRQWLLDGSDDGVARNPQGGSKAAPGDDLVAGRIVSYLWHILFARYGDDGGINLEELNRDSCPSAEECYCRLYGRCTLTCKAPGSCKGQYAVPKYFKLPKDWEETHP
jgi:hypothetical protein